MTGYFQVLGVCTLMFAVQVSGISLSFSQNDIIIGSTGTLTMRCSLNEPDVQGVFSIQILRATSLNSPDTEVLASIDALTNDGNPALSGNLNNNKDFVVGGNLNTDNPSSSELTLDMNIAKLNCDDAREYICESTYKNNQDKLTSVKINETFSAYVYPVITILHGKRNEEYIEGSVSSSPASFEVGDQLHLTCTANIGSYEATLIKWRKTSEIGTQDDFIGYQPQEGSFTNGEASMVSGGCSYMRTATITYNTTVADANRDNHLAFECYVSVTGGPYGQGYTTVNNPRFYVDVTGGQAPDQGSVASAGSGNVGAIAGGVVGGLVFIVIIVLLVYFLWYRRRNSGEDYTTKEEYGSENPNMAPADNTYSYPDKSRTRRGHENKGLDEPHESHRKRHHYENGPGKSNHGMDRSADDYDSRDGSPTMDRSINHMGGDGGFGTGV